MFVDPKWSPSISRILIALTTALVAGSCSSVPSPRVETEANRPRSRGFEEIRTFYQRYVASDRARPHRWCGDIHSKFAGGVAIRLRTSGLCRHGKGVGAGHSRLVPRAPTIHD